MNTECPICLNTVAPHDTECNTCGAELDPIDSSSAPNAKSKKATTWTATKSSPPPSAGFGGRTASKSPGWGNSRSPQAPVETPKPKAKIPRGVAIVQEGIKADSIPLLEGKTSIRREEDHDIVLSDDRVSGFHGIIYLDEKSQRYLDVSTNGSKINGNTCHYDKVELQNGSRIEIGEVIITFVLIPPAG